MKNYTLIKKKAQAGMTLIELTVVLLILIGLAGLTLPYVGGFIGKTHNSTSASSGADLYNALAVYQAQTTSYPNGLNVLIDTSGGSTPVSYLDNTFTATAPGSTFSGVPTNFAILADSASGGIYQSLRAAGITTVSGLPTGTITVNADGTFTPGSGIATTGATFTPERTLTNIATTNQKFVTDSCGGVYYAAGVTPTCTNSFTPASLAQTGIANALNYTKLATETNNKMIVLGIGPQNTAVGRSLASVPVHFGDQASLQPANTYSRFLAAFDVDTTGANAAKLVGIVHAPDVGDQWESLYSSISSYYQN